MPETIDPAIAWNSDVVKNYPVSIYLPEYGCSILFTDIACGSITSQVLDHLDCIPETDPILDLGAGSNSHTIYGEEITRSQVTAADCSRILLGQSLVPPENRIEMDLRTDEFPSNLEETFGLVVASELWRYLTHEQRNEVVQKTLPLMKSGANFVIASAAETHSFLGPYLGQVEKVDLATEVTRLQQSGFEHIEKGEIKIGIDSSTNHVEIIFISGTKP